MLLANGHPDARKYPLGMLEDEALLVEQRENHRIASEASLVQAAINGAMSKEGAKAFNRQITSLRIRLQAKETEPEEETSRADDQEPPTDFSSVDVAAVFGPGARR